MQATIGQALAPQKYFWSITSRNDAATSQQNQVIRSLRIPAIHGELCRNGGDATCVQYLFKVVRLGRLVGKIGVLGHKHEADRRLWFDPSSLDLYHNDGLIPWWIDAMTHSEVWWQMSFLRR
jgi:hypothetical protein